jgi:hypothetical protein
VRQQGVIQLHKSDDVAKVVQRHLDG